MQPLPNSWTVQALPGLTRSGDFLVGSKPFKVVRLSTELAIAVDALLAGAVITDAETGRLARRLVNDGFASAQPGENRERTAADTTVVVPAFNASSDLPRLLGGPVVAAAGAVVVADDASTDDTATVAAGLGAEVVRLTVNGGPAAARNAGWRRAHTPLIVFADVDADADADLGDALAQFDDPAVAVVAPRVRVTTEATPTLTERYELVRSSYDLGPMGGDIGAGRRLTYAASLLLLARVAALESVDGFSDRLRFGEDLDLIRRLAAAGWVVRYEPSWVGTHRARNRFGPLLRLHFRYGYPTAQIARDLRGRVGRATLSFPMWLAMLFAVVGAPFVAAGLVVVALLATFAALATRVPLAVAATVTRRVELQSLRTAMALVSTAWLIPSLVCVAVFRSWFGAAVVLGSVLLRHLLDWRRARPSINPVTWIALCVLDDQALALGVWAGVARTFNLSVVTPRFERVGGRLADGQPDMQPGWTYEAVFGVDDQTR